MRIYEAALFASLLLLSISSPCRPDVVPLGDSLPVESNQSNQYATTVNEAVNSPPSTANLEQAEAGLKAAASREEGGLPTIIPSSPTTSAAPQVNLPPQNNATATPEVDPTQALVSLSSPQPPEVPVALLQEKEAKNANESNSMRETLSGGDLLQAEETNARLLSRHHQVASAARTTRSVASFSPPSPTLPSAEVPSNRIGNLRRTIPGEPNVDYPIFSQPPQSSFNCTGRHDGYYADLEARCQVFRVCANTDLTGKGFAFLCPNGTLFNQKVFVCDWYNNVDCSASEQYYDRNEEAKILMGHPGDMMEHVKQMQDFPFDKPNYTGTTSTGTTTTRVTGGAHKPPSPVTRPTPAIIPNTRPSPIPTKTTIPERYRTPFPTLRPSPVPLPSPTPVPPLPQRPFGIADIGQLNVDFEDLLNNRLPAEKTSVLHPYPGQHFPGDQLELQPVHPTHPQTTITTSFPGIIPQKVEKGGDKNTLNDVEPVVVSKGIDSDTHNNLHRPQTVYVSNLGELSTDVNSGFDINKSKFLVVDSKENVAGENGIVPGSNLLVDLLEEQVSLLGQAVNLNGLTKPTKINSNRTPSRFLPRIIASNVIVPLPKGFQKQGIVVGEQQPPTPTYMANGFIAPATRTTTTGQFPTEQFSFPAGIVSQPVLPVVPSSVLSVSLPLPLTMPSSPVPFTVAPLQYKLTESLSSSIGFSPLFAAVRSPTTPPPLPASSGDGGLSVEGADGLSLQLEATEAGLKQKQPQKQEQQKKQIFTYPQDSEQELGQDQPQHQQQEQNINYSDTARSSVSRPESSSSSSPPNTIASLNGLRAEEEKQPAKALQPSADDDSAVAGSGDDQQFANSAPAEFVYHHHHPHYEQYPQQVHQSFHYNQGHVPSAQSPPVSPATSAHEQGELPRVLPSVTQSFDEVEQRSALQLQRDHSVIKIIPVMGFSLEDPQERSAYFEALSRGLFSAGDNSNQRDATTVYVNKVQQDPNYYQEQPSFDNGLINFSQLPAAIRGEADFGPYSIVRGTLEHEDDGSSNGGNQREQQMQQNFYNNQQLNDNNYLRFNYGVQATANGESQQIQGRQGVEERREGQHEGGSEGESKRSIFDGSSSYAVALNSVGRLDSDIEKQHQVQQERMSYIRSFAGGRK